MAGRGPAEKTKFPKLAASQRSEKTLHNQPHGPPADSSDDRRLENDCLPQSDGVWLVLLVVFSFFFSFLVCWVGVG